MKFTVALAALAACNLVAAHPGDDHAHELKAREAFLASNKRNLDHCAKKIKARGLESRMDARRSELADKLRQIRGIDERGLQNNDQKYSFENKGSCVLALEATEGPYYVAGEYIRENIIDGEEGVPLAFGVQFLDVTTCEPVVGAYIDAWQANSTGVYGGIINDGNGSGASDPGNLQKTFGRGVQPTDADGIASFVSFFPGHYVGRTIHIHVMAHLRAEPTAQGTLVDTTAAHVGQFYFQQDLIDEVERLAPYNTNDQPLTTNDEDRFLKLDLQWGGNPFIEVKRVGESLEDGLVGWISFGINTTFSRDVHAAETYKAAAPSNTAAAFVIN